MEQKRTEDSPKGKPKQKPKMKLNRSIRILWIVFVLFIVAIPFTIMLINNGYFGYMPSLSELENPQSATSSDVIASDGTLLGRYYVQDRSSCKFSDISPNIVNALLAAEDIRFYEHAGIDWKATMAIPLYIIMHKKRGSSTITQQLAKNLFPRKGENVVSTAFAKLKEWVLAVRIERNLTKQEIMTMYLNTVPFGDNIYGIRNASLTFYNKTPDKITVDEAAVLVGLLKGNTIYNPRSHPKKSQTRRNDVLDQMYKYDKISKAELDTLKAKETKLDYHKIDYHEGAAPYFRQVVEQEVKQMLKGIKKPDGTPYDIYKDGLKIYTTLDPRMQRYAEEAMQEHLTDLQKTFLAQPGYKDGSVWSKNAAIENILSTSIKETDRYQMFKGQNMTDARAMEQMKKPIKMKVFAWTKNHYKDTVMSPIDSIKYTKVFLQSGFMAMDPFTGEVKAWVGGIDHNFFQYDHVNVNTKRQVGSTIKPLLYTYAIKNGFSPCDILKTEPQSFPTKENYDAGGSEEGDITMKYALALSINNSALYVLKSVGIEPFVDFVHKCGITSRIDKVPSVALGVSDISLFEMMGAYSMFPGGGMNTQPYFITRVEDKNGMLIKNFAPVQKEIIDPITAYKMVNMMRGVVNFGTGGRTRFRYKITSDVAGKTGTTNNQADAWFIGYCPQLLAGAWVGCDDREFRFRNERLGQGAAAALPIWALFMRRVYADKSLNIDPAKTFKIPEGYADCQVADTAVLNKIGEDAKKAKNGDEDYIEQVEKPDPATQDYE